MRAPSSAIPADAVAVIGEIRSMRPCRLTQDSPASTLASLDGQMAVFERERGVGRGRPHAQPAVRPAQLRVGDPDREPAPPGVLHHLRVEAPQHEPGLALRVAQLEPAVLDLGSREPLERPPRLRGEARGRRLRRHGLARVAHHDPRPQETDVRPGLPRPVELDPLGLEGDTLEGEARRRGRGRALPEVRARGSRDAASPRPRASPSARGAPAPSCSRLACAGRSGPGRAPARGGGPGRRRRERIGGARIAAPVASASRQVASAHRRVAPARRRVALAPRQVASAPRWQAYPRRRRSGSRPRRSPNDSKRCHSEELGPAVRRGIRAGAGAGAETADSSGPVLPRSLGMTRSRASAGHRAVAQRGQPDDGQAHGAHARRSSGGRS